MTDAHIVLWGRRIAAVTWDSAREIGVFQYTPDFAGSGIQVAPLTMPLRDAPYEFPALNRETFKGLPGLIADSLPDKFGNALIDIWLAERGRTPESFDPVERLCYTGSRGMGALEFEPKRGDVADTSRPVELDALVDLANRALDDRAGLAGRFDGVDDRTTVEDILRVGTSAGGARAKAVLAWNEATGEFRSGQIPAGTGFRYWIVKFDGVTGNSDKEVADPQGFGRIEYAYHLMARAAGIDMAPCRLLEEGGRAHFMTRRFDRTESGAKLHMQSLCAMRHYDFNQTGVNSYEQAVQTVKRLALDLSAVEEQCRRAFFNVIARNQDDHAKNIAYLMDRSGRWQLSPAYDVAYAYNPDGAWTSRHQLSLAGKRDGFTEDDLTAHGKSSGLKPARIKRILTDIRGAIDAWPGFAERAGLSRAEAGRISAAFRRL